MNGTKSNNKAIGERAEFSLDDVEVKAKQPLYQGFLTTEKWTLRHRLFAGGWTPWIEREVMRRGHAVMVIPYDRQRDEMVVLEQFRVGAMETSDSPWLYEFVAGMIDEGETLEQVAMRELSEETGIQQADLTYALSYLSSPGGTTERIHIYIADVDASHGHKLAGLDAEHEDIKVHRLARTVVMDMLEQGKIDNAASVIGLQWFQLHQQQWLTK
ncbi:NUDIX domain-containing protein [Idiomarina tyrosinivorans]|uniref:NUDIX domain-containing protein n=1 Tax=Idiomarina tyrosinivorans TaxID=1445662 RepID=UPI001F545FDD|nr:NUDIX domain-containing protein [Idiomarina tyrosinivorans]